MSCLLSDLRDKHCRFWDDVRRRLMSRGCPVTGGEQRLLRVLAVAGCPFSKKRIYAFAAVGVVQIANKMITFTRQLLA